MVKRPKSFNGKILKESDLEEEQKSQRDKSPKKEVKVMPTGGRKDPYRKYNFIVEIDGIPQAGFMECSGLESETEVIEYREGNEPNTVRLLPGLTFYTNVILKDGVTESKDLYYWRKKVIDGEIERKAFSIVLLNDKREPITRWNFKQGWPCRMSGPDLHAIESDIAIEELEICHEGFERE